VRSGDTIRKIAKRYVVAGGWRGLWQLNKKTVKDPNRIYVGQVLRIR
jgi:nucleoid-associated protein YgaU